MILCGAVQPQLASAQARAEVAATCSVSGQFFAHAPRLGMPSRFAPLDAQKPALQPALLVIACERIKEVLIRKLAGTGAWENQIHLHPRPARSRTETGCIVVERPLTRWIYRVDLPDCLDEERLTLLIVQAVLLEIANRGAANPSAEIPPWLVQGFTEELLAASAAELILPGLEHRTELGFNLSRTVEQGIRQDPLARAQQTLRSVAPLTFEQLSWPAETVQSSGAAAAFRSSAHLFVNRLLALPGGPAGIQRTLAGLPHHLNWQFAFLGGFNSRFQSQLDVEKWWALQVVQFTGRDLTLTFTIEESCRKLHEVLHVPVDVRTVASELPRQRDATLQEVIRDWDSIAQQGSLRRKLMELELLRARMAQDAMALIDGYRSVLSVYLESPTSAGSILPFRRSPGRGLSRPAEEAIRNLDILDARLAELYARAGTVSGPEQPGP